MTDTRFIAVPAQGRVVAEIGALSPTNPFATASFFESRQRAGCVSWILGLRDDTRGFECGCGGFLRTGRLNRTLEIPSLPAVAADSVFWEGLREFCRLHRVTELDLGTFGSSPGAEIPPLGTHCRRRSRCEFVLYLSGDLVAMLSSNHRRNLKRAQKAGLTMRRTRSAEAASAHQALMSESLDRRRSRGEHVGPIGPSRDDLAFLQSGAGELFQAVRDATVLSSVLVLRAPKAGYYQSAGTSQEGMAAGASHFLIHGIASELKAEGAQLFNLGGADDASTLARFKAGFGASRVDLPSASCYVGAPWRRWTSRAITLVRSDRAMLRRYLFGRISRLRVYATDTASIAPAEPQAGLAFGALTSEDLRTLSVGDPAFRSRQLERLNRFGASYAYAVFVGEQIAHVSWLLPATAIERDAPRVLKARADEAEISCCETLPEFRGRGLYGVAIRHLTEVARGQRIRRVFMKTAADNKASQSGIEKAGLARIGSAVLVFLPVSQRLVVWRQFR